MRDLVVIVILVTAIVTDVRGGRISNRLMMAGLLTGIVFSIATDGVAGIGAWFLSVSVPVIFCSILFLMRALGAGDIKLFSVIGGLSDIRTICYCILFSFVAGAVLALFKMIRKKIFWPRIFYFRDYVQRVLYLGKLLPYEDMEDEEKGLPDHKIHFSVAIGIGFCICRGYLLWGK